MGSPALQLGYHDHCFDGVASAATFLRFYREKVRPGLGVDRVGFQGLAHRAGPLFGEDAFAGEENAVVDFRYTADPRLTWWFDHHQSAFESPSDEAHFRADRSGRKFWDPAAKSCTRFLARVCQERFGWDFSPLSELVEWAEVIDGAQFPDPKTAVELTEPAMQLMLLIEASKDPRLRPRLIRELSQRPLSEVLREAWVVQPLEPLLARHREIVRTVRANNRSPIFLPVVEGNPDLAGVGDHVIVGENVPSFVDDESGALSFLRNQAIEKIVGHGPGRDVYHRSDVFAIDADVVLLFGVERIAACRLSDLDLGRGAYPVGRMQSPVTVGGEVEKRSGNNDGESKRADDSHR